MLSPASDDPNRAKELKRKAAEPETFGKILTPREREERDKRLADKQTGKG